MSKRIFRKSMAILLALCLCLSVLVGLSVSAQSQESAKVVALDFSKQGETSAFVTKTSYPGGSTFSFDVYVPTEASWWGVCWTTDPTNTSIYNVFNTGTGTISNGNNAWTTYTYTLPADANNYYLYFAAECNASNWTGKTVLVDNFTVKTDETEVTDDFDSILGAGLFRVANAKVVSLIDYDYDGVSIFVAKMSDDASKPSFITKDSYPAQSTITFDAYVPDCGTNDQWWGIKSTTDPQNANIYSCWREHATCVEHAGEWHNYSFNIGGNTGEDRYIYLGGNVGTNWMKNGVPQAMIIKNVKIIAPNGTVLATEDFSGGLSRNIFKCQSVGSNKNTVVTVSGENVVRENIYAAISIDKLASNESSPADFITKNAYPGGSTVTFDACTPTDASWWAISYTADLSDVGLYRWTEKGFGTSYNTTGGVWKTYTYTLPDDGKSYYIYFVGAKGEWGGKSLLIDNVVITAENGDCLTYEDFSAGITNCIFNAMDQAVTDSRLAVEKPNVYSAAIKVDAMSAQSFITKKAYPGGSRVTFEAYIPKTNGKENKWWGVCFTTNPADSSVYNVFTPGKGKQLGIREEEWATYSFTLPDDGNEYYFHFGANISNWSMNGEAVSFLVDQITVLSPQNYLLAKEDFENGLDTCIFNYQAVAVSLYEETAALFGDLNNDGDIDVIDLVIIKKYLANMTTLTLKAKAAADFNKNSSVDSTDLILLKQFILAGIKPEDAKEAFIGENGNWWIGEYDTGISVASTSGDIVSLSVRGTTPTFEYATPAKDVALNVVATYLDGSEQLLGKSDYEIENINALTYQSEGVHTGTVSLREDPSKKTDFNYSVTAKKSLKVLFIGNSFSECTVYLLHDVATSLGIDLQVEDMYIAGCPIDDHYYNLTNDLKKYKHRYWYNGTWKETDAFDQSLTEVLAAENWDFISVQQASADSGVESSYSNIYNFINLIQTKLTDKNHTRFVFNMTWAYDVGSPNEGFANYGNSQTVMYQSILNCTKKLNRNVIDIIIPNGTAVQNNRTSYLGDVLTYDGTHLTYPYGDFIASLTAIKALTGVNIDNISYTPKDVDTNQKKVAIESANNAFKKPYEVTNSVYTVTP